MITVRLQGGLGNQIFQYAAALAVRKEMGGGPISLVETTNVHNTLGHDYATNLFLEGRPHHSVPLTTMTSYIQYSAFESWSPGQFIRGGTIYLQGYFQSLPELIPILPELRASFLPALRKQTQIHISPSPTTGFVHVRRGDYLLNPTYHWVQPASYYEKGMSLIKAERWLVFSDDIDWCRQQPCFQKDTVVFCDEPNELIALDVMTTCRAGAVISNSSFSWWAAVLGEIDTVVYPELWSEHHKPNLFPESWLRLSSSSS